MPSEKFYILDASHQAFIKECYVQSVPIDQKKKKKNYWIMLFDSEMENNTFSVCYLFPITFEEMKLQ